MSSPSKSHICSSPERYRYIGNTLQFLPSKTPKNILVIRRFYGDTFGQFLSLLKHLFDEHGELNYFCELKEQDLIEKGDTITSTITYIDTDNLKNQTSNNKISSIHLVITLGGDGTLLYAASLFQKSSFHCPPFLPIALGSLGFLTPLKLGHFKSVVGRILSEKQKTRSDTLEFNAEEIEHSGVESPKGEAVDVDSDSQSPPISIRTLSESFETNTTFLSPKSNDSSTSNSNKPILVPRLRSNIPESQLFDLEEPIFVTKRVRLYVKVRDLLKASSTISASSSFSQIVVNSTTQPSSSNSTQQNAQNTQSSGQTSGKDSSGSSPSISRKFCLNEVVIDRGPNHGSIHLEIYINDKLIADVRGDGLIISTPTGSTAYSLSAGASIVHPSTVGVIITPICPHSLSLRPLVIPPGVKLQIKVPEDNRNMPWISFDGRDAHQLNSFNEISVILPEKIEEYGGFVIPCICLRDPVDDFFLSLSSCLSWNNNSFVAKNI